MKAFLRLVPALIVLGGTLADAGERCGDGPIGHERTCMSSALLAGCRDDYCPNPMPRIACLPCGVPDDYCRKALPRIGRLPCGVPDDYCRKPWPQVCRPLRSENYNCGHQDH